MSIRVLNIDENMEDMRKMLSEEANRSAYIISYPIVINHDCRYREQHEAEYGRRSSLELSLNRLTDKGKCVKRVDYDESTIFCDGKKEIIPAYSIRNFDLYPATVLYFAIPVASKENIQNIMSLIRMNQRYDNLSIQLSASEIVPNELIPFLQQRKGLPPNRKITTPTLEFVVSEPFMQPAITQTEWHFGRVQPNMKCDNTEFEYTGFVSLHPPGQYSEEELKFVPSEEWNRMVVCSTKPGPCIICHGSNDEWNHFGTVDWGGGLRSAGLICKICLPKAFESWMKLIDQVKPEQWKLSKIEKDV